MGHFVYVLKPGTTDATGTNANGTDTPTNVTYFQMECEEYSLRLSDEYTLNRLPTQNDVILGLNKIVGQVTFNNWVIGSLGTQANYRVFKFLTYMLGNWKRLTGKYSEIYWNTISGGGAQAGAPNVNTSRQFWDAGKGGGAGLINMYGICKEINFAENFNNICTVSSITFDLVWKSS